MIYRITAIEDYSSKFVNVYFLLAEFLPTETFDPYKWVKLQFQVVLFGQIKIWRLLCVWTRLGDKYGVDLVLLLLCALDC